MIPGSRESRTKRPAGRRERHAALGGRRAASSAGAQARGEAGRRAGTCGRLGIDFVLRLASGTATLIAPASDRAPLDPPIEPPRPPELRDEAGLSPLGLAASCGDRANGGDGTSGGEAEDAPPCKLARRAPVRDPVGDGWAEPARAMAVDHSRRSSSVASSSDGIEPRVCRVAETVIAFLR